MEITGTIIHIGPIQNISQTFRKRDIVLKTDEQFPQEIILQVSQHRCEWLDSMELGNQVTATFNLRGRPWEGAADGETKWFNTLEAWKIKTVSNAVNSTQATPQNNTPNPPDNQAPAPTEEDDLPF